MIPISVVIPTYQRAGSVCRALRALARQTCPTDAFEAVVSIDGSTDGTLEAVRALDVPFRLKTRVRPNRGRAVACNAGVDAAEGEWVVLLDDDMEPEPGFLDAHRRRQAGQAKRGVLGGVPVAVRPSDPPAVRYMGAKFNRHLDALAQSGRRLGLRDFYSGNFSIARGTFLRVGGFDEAFRAYGNEDLELSLRLADAGVEIVYEPEARAVQWMDKGFPALAADHEAKGQTAVLLATKHPAAFAALKLGTYRNGPLPLRAVRDAALAASRRWPTLPAHIVRAEGWLSRVAPGAVAPLYPPALGYFYWLGVSAALGADPPDAEQFPGLADLAMRLRA